MPFLQAIWIVTRKDLLVEFRSREVVYTTLFFAVSVLAGVFLQLRAGGCCR